jgi:16S rRNA G966 N2-methylase RsmD
MDPPYNAGVIYKSIDAILAVQCLSKKGILIAETSSRDDFYHDGVELIKQKVYGGTMLSFMRLK